MEVGMVQKIDIDAEMQQAYLDYAMSVIVARALPDARDGLKPVHRRILYAMYDMGLRTDSAYKKSARIVGEVLGKYHPHGDMAVYDAMARMAQDFSMRYLLVDGQGNFGSVDGDPPAAMRYTEARLAAPAFHMLTDIQRNTVDFDPNFDGTLSEPQVLPSAIPNLLVNGATGIAVGMSTSIPPHNMGEVVDALRHLLENWDKLDDINVEDIMRFIQGPDFPTGGVILQNGGDDDLKSAYASGRGRVVVRARVHLEEMERGRNRFIVTELPYMTNKASLIERIADLVREEKLEGIVDLRDESDRHGMRIVIELNKTADPKQLLLNLYKYTPMQSTFSMILLALVEGEPRMLSLKQALRVYLDHRLEIVRRRSLYDLEKARQRAHILEGLRVALNNLDEVISLIRKAPDADTAKERLMKRFKLSDIQAQAILDMQLRRLAALERKKIEEEYKQVQALIKELEILLRSPKKMRQVVGDELLQVKEAYFDPRRTLIVHRKEGEPDASLLMSNELAPDQPVWVTITPNGLISRTADDKPPRLSGADSASILVQGSTRDVLFLVSEQGDAAALALHAVPETADAASGLRIEKVSALREGSRVAAAFSLPDKTRRAEGGFVLSVTRLGMLKKSPLTELPGPSAGTFTLVRINPGDRLGWLRITQGEAEVLMVSAQGMAIRFNEEEVRPMGLVAAGVMGMKLQAGDEVAGVETLPKPGEVLLVASDGSGKRVAVDQFPRQGRYGQGVQAWKLPAKTRLVAMAIGKGTQQARLLFARQAPKSIRLDEAPLASRAARGHAFLQLKGEDQVVGLAIAGDMLPQTPVKPDGTGAGKKGGSATQTRKTTPAKPATTKTAASKPPAKKTTSKPATKATTAKSSPSPKASTPTSRSKKASATASTAPRTKAEPTIRTSPASKATTTAKTGSKTVSKTSASKTTASKKTAPKTGTSKTTASKAAPKTTAKPAANIANIPAPKATTGSKSKPVPPKTRSSRTTSSVPAQPHLPGIDEETNGTGRKPRKKSR